MEEKQYPQIGLFRSKFAGVCPLCGDGYAVNDVVVWAKGTKARHPACVADRKKPMRASASVDPSTVSWRRLPSKFAGRCPVCSQTFDVGDEVSWAKGMGSRHPECVGDNGRPMQEDAYPQGGADDSDIPF